MPLESSADRVPRVLIVHNAYRQRGGEDAVVEAEAQLLRAHGHRVDLYRRHNSELAEMSAIRAARDAFWSPRTAAETRAAIADFRPDVLHAHNIWPLISPSLYWAAAQAHVPVVQTLHNFRLLCPQAMMLRHGNVCEDCVGRVPWRGLLHRCYRESAAQSAVAAGTLTLHRVLGTWSAKVTRYIALTEFSRRQFVAGGLPARKLTVKPNFVDWAQAPPGVPSNAPTSPCFLFVGRLSPEKGMGVLEDALRLVPGSSIRIAGTGPCAASLQRLAGATLLGALTPPAVQGEMQGALALVVPSICYEHGPRTLVEAFACGLPVIASRLGAMAELVRDNETGMLFKPGDAGDLASKIRWARENPDGLRAMGVNARREYEARYTPDSNYRQLAAIYADAIREAGSGER